MCARRRGAQAAALIADATRLTIYHDVYVIQGDQRFSSMVRGYYRRATACVIVFDLTKHSTFEVSSAHSKVDMLITMSGFKDGSKRRHVPILEPCLTPSPPIDVLTPVLLYQHVRVWKSDVDDRVKLPSGEPVPCLLLGNKVSHCVKSMPKCITAVINVLGGHSSALRFPLTSFSCSR